MGAEKTSIESVIHDAVEAAVRRALDEQLLLTEEAAELLDITPAALRKRVQRGTISAVRAGRSLRFRRRDLLPSEGK